VVGAAIARRDPLSFRHDRAWRGLERRHICTRIEADGSDYVVNGHKWWISGAIRPECKVFVLLGKTRFDGPQHSQQSMILVPRDSPGVQIFEIAQGRLGPGRIHHCMRSLSVAELALASMVDRSFRRKAFGQLLAEKDAVRMAIAEARIEITQCRQLCYLAAVVADEKGFKAAKNHIAMIKIAAPRAALKIIDEAIQIHGAHGVSQDSKLGMMYMGMRTLRVADGPDMVHLLSIAKSELDNREGHFAGRIVSGLNPNVQKYGKFSHVEGGDLYIHGSSKL